MLIIINYSYADDYCETLGGKFCTAEEYCNGNEKIALNNYEIGSCCIGTCNSYNSVFCENVTKIENSVNCAALTSKEKLSNYKISSLSLFIKLFNPQITAKPIQKLYNFWMSLFSVIGTIIVILTAFKYLSLLFDPAASPEEILSLKNKMFFFIFGILFVFVFPHVISFLFTTLNFTFTVISRIFVDDGNVLALSEMLTKTDGANILFLMRDFLFFLFLIILLLRYLVITVLLVFSPIMIFMYLFVLTEKLGTKWLTVLLISIFMPALWLLLFALLIPIASVIGSSVSEGILLPVFMSAIIYFNISIYRTLIGLEFSFREIVFSIVKLWSKVM
ncbi:MAG: hypothetical protein V1859_02225 [archaeon]